MICIFQYQLMMYSFEVSYKGRQLYIVANMSGQFRIEQEGPIDWLKEVSQFTENHLSLNSSISKSHFLDDLLNEKTISSKNQQRIRSKHNSKNYRQRKKNQQEHIKQQIQHLRHENKILRSQKYCRNCKRSYQPQVLLQQQKYISQYMSRAPSFSLKEDIFEKQPEKQQEVQFQKIDFSHHHKQNRKGKIWMALGILMLVLGITLHGFNGNSKEVTQIQIFKEDIQRWGEQLQSKEEQFIQVEMRIKQQTKSMNKVSPDQLKIYYRSKQKDETMTSNDKDRISINKDLLFGIHAEIDDIGVYF